MKKKLTAVALIVCMLAIMLVGASLAYFTDTDDATNTFTVGNVDIMLEEPAWDESGSKDAPEVYPGEKLAKDPTVTNIGANPCFVRIKVEGLDCLENACGQAAGADTLITIEGVSSEWTLYEGYYYYNKVLPAVDDTTTEADERVTPACFAGIRIPTALINGDADTKFDVKVYAEAVQAQGAAPSWSNVVNGQNPVTAMTVEEIADWFGTAFDAE